VAEAEETMRSFEAAEGNRGPEPAAKKAKTDAS